MTEVKAALASAITTGTTKSIPELYAAVAGLGGADVRPGHFVALANHMVRRGRTLVFLGVKHEHALEASDDPDVRPKGAFSLRGHSVGGFGSVTTNKVIATVAADLFGLHVQAFSHYGSEKKGLPTNYYLTLAGEPVKLHAALNTVEFVAIQNPQAFSSGDPLHGLVDGGTIYLQSELPAEKIWATLTAPTQRAILDRKLKLWVLDAARIARELASRGDLQIRMQGIALLGAFLRLTPFREQHGLTEDQLFDSLHHVLTKYFGKQGATVVEENVAVARRGYREVIQVVPVENADASKAAAVAWHWDSQSLPDGRLVAEDFCERVVECYAHGREMELPADSHAARSLMPPATALHRSFRHLAPDLPLFHAEHCVGCMECVNECPDTAILARVVEPRVLDAIPPDLRNCFVKTGKYYDVLEKRGEAGGLFGIFIDPDKCKGCGECVTVCGTHHALDMAPKSTLDLAAYDAGMSLLRSLPPTPTRFINEKALGDMMLSDRGMLYSGGAGSCTGCGEGTALRLLLSATGFVYGAEQMGIVAATGCNTVFGSTYPYNPFQSPVDEFAFRKCARRRHGNPAAMGSGGVSQAPAVGSRRGRCALRYRLSVAIPSDDVRNGYQGPRARYPGLLQYRRPEFHRDLYLAGGEDGGIWQGRARQARASQGTRHDCHDASGRVRGSNDASPFESFLSVRYGSQRISRTGHRHLLRRLHAGARNR